MITRWSTWFVFFIQLFLMSAAVGANLKTTKLPGESAKYLPVLNQELDTYWANHPNRAWAAAVPDQEANWKPNAMLRTSREWGCGLGQFTVAYNADGSVRFDALAETRRLDPSLKDWSWEDCANVQYQLRGMVLKTKANYRDCAVQMADARNALACDGAKYNGGAGSVTKRIRLCRLDKTCNPKLWFGNLENQCGQSNVKVAGYGESFCMINSKYPGRLEARMPKFEPYFSKK